MSTYNFFFKNDGASKIVKTIITIQFKYNKKKFIFFVFFVGHCLATMLSPMPHLICSSYLMLASLMYRNKLLSNQITMNLQICNFSFT
jgi:hypothetical protein